MSGTPYDERMNAYAAFQAALSRTKLGGMNRREILSRIDIATFQLEAALAAIAVESGERTAIPPCPFRVGQTVTNKQSKNKKRGFIEIVVYRRMSDCPRWWLIVDDGTRDSIQWLADDCELVEQAREPYPQPKELQR